MRLLFGSVIKSVLPCCTVEGYDQDVLRQAGLGKHYHIHENCDVVESVYYITQRKLVIDKEGKFRLRQICIPNLIVIVALYNYFLPLFTFYSHL